MLAVRYDLAKVAAAVTKDALRLRPPGMYRFRELVPLADGEEPVALGEVPIRGYDRPMAVWQLG